MDVAAFWLSGSALLLSTAPRLSNTVEWILNCDTCLRMRHAVAAFFGT